MSSRNSKSLAFHAVTYELAVAGRALLERGPQGRRDAVICLDTAALFNIRADECREVRRALQGGLSNRLGFALVQGLWGRVLDGRPCPLVALDYSHMVGRAD